LTTKKKLPEVVAGHCRGSRAPIEWIPNKSGRTLPVDLAKMPILHERMIETVFVKYGVWREPRNDDEVFEARTNHYSTCRALPVKAPED